MQRLEQGESTQLTNPLRILRALDLVRNLETLVPVTALSPLQLWNREGQQRQRACSHADQEAPGPWKWGEEQ